MKLWGFFILIPLFGMSQVVSYTPGPIIERVLPPTHYDTDFIYIKNNTTEPIELWYDLLVENPVSGWYASVCTGSTCLNYIPKSGLIAVVDPKLETYISLNLSTNEKLGDGEFSFIVYSKTHSQIRDTVKFIYHVKETPQNADIPWIRVNKEANAITVLLKNNAYQTELYLFNLAGQLVYQIPVEGISSFRLDDFQAGTYVLVVQDELGRRYQEKVVKI